MLQLAADDWTFRGLLCASGAQLCAASVERMATRQPRERRTDDPQAANSARREALLRAVERSAHVELPEDAPAVRLRHRETARAACGILARLSVALAELPREATAGEWQKAMVKLAGELGLLRAMDDDCGAALAKFDRIAWQQLLDGLDASQRLETQLDGRPARFSLAELIVRLDEIAGATDLPPPNDDVGRVRVLSAASVRTLDVPFLFVAGLSEKAFPAPFGEHHLYSAAECRAMNKAGLRFVDRHEWACQEMLLFYEVVTRATRRLTLSYPALDEKAQPLSPSPYLLELERLFAGAAIARHDEPSLSPVVRDKPPACMRDLRVTGVAHAIEGDGKLAAGLLSPGRAGGLLDERVANLFAALRMTGQRAKRDAFGQFEGVVLSEAAQRRLAERFGDEHCWSTSRLERYAYCPFKFFAQHVLAIEEPEDLALEIDHLAPGTAVARADGGSPSAAQCRGWSLFAGTAGRGNVQAIGRRDTGSRD